ncbi:FHA domain-containing protein [Planctomycetota bacterium]
MVIKFFCSCGKKVSIPDENRNQGGKCPKCGEQLSLKEADPTRIQRDPMLVADLDGTDGSSETRVLEGRSRRKASADETDAQEPVIAVNLPSNDDTDEHEPVVMASAPSHDETDVHEPVTKDETAAVAVIPIYGKEATPPVAPPSGRKSLAELAAEIDDGNDTDAFSVSEIQLSITEMQKEHFEPKGDTEGISVDAVQAALQEDSKGTGTAGIETGGDSDGTGTAGIEAGGVGRLLYKKRGKGEQQTFPLGGGVTIGRSSELDISILEAGVSREHCRVVFEDGAYFVEDGGSRNGVRVNGKKTERAKLLKGDKILLGNAVLFFME